jgi:hypothetical protein
MRNSFLVMATFLLGLFATISSWSSLTPERRLDHPVDDGVDAVDHLLPDSHPVANQNGTCGCCDCATYRQLTAPQEG